MSPHRPRSLHSARAKEQPIHRVAGLDYDVLDELLGYSLRRAQVTMFLAFRDATRGTDLTPPRFTALVIIGANPGLSQSVLGQVLGIARSGAMLMTDFLEARGLVERRRRAGDARAWGLYLTRRGQQLVERIKARVLQHEQRIVGKMSPQERRQLVRLLEKLAR
jgi:DNA-binding MarR family transcriptional regulator